MACGGRTGAQRTPEHTEAWNEEDLTSRSALLAVGEAIAVRNRCGLGDHDRLPAGHGLEEGRRRAGVGVLAHGGRDDARRIQALADDRQRDVDLDDEVGTGHPQEPCVVAAADEPEAATRQPARQLDEQPEVAPLVGPDGDDVLGRLAARLGTEALDVDPEGDEHDARSAGVVADPRAELLDLAVSVGDDGVQAPERVTIAPSHAFPTDLREALGNPMATYTTAVLTSRARTSSTSGMPTVSTVESTTSTRLSARRQARTCAKSPE
jgi:hypothetical protein